MKVLWFTNTPSLAVEELSQKETGGGWIKELDRILQSEVDLHVAFYSRIDKEPFKLGNTTYYPILRKSTLFQKVVKYIFNTVEPKSDLKIYLELVSNIKPDIVHILGSENPFGLIQKYVDIPVVISMQGIVSVISYKFFSGLERKYSKKTTSFLNFLIRKNQYHNYKQLLTLAKREREILKTTKHIIGRTDWDKYVTSVLSPGRRYYHNDEILRNGFYENIWKPNNNKRLILHTTTNPSFYKGFETIFLAASFLKSLDIDFVWNIAGLSDKDDVVKTVINKFSDTLFTDNIKLLGMLDEQALIKYMLGADIYVTASHIENSPNNVCEAMLLGMPVIATQAGGTSSMLENNKEGILIQDGDPWSMAGAITSYYREKEKLVKLGSKAREKALRRHNKNEIVSGLVDIYKRILKQKR